MVTLLVAFGGLALGFPYFWVAFPVGFAGLVPVAVALARLYENRETDEPTPESTDADAALARLRERYANDELTDAEFERRVERPLETESTDDAAEWYERERNADDATADREPSDGERSVEREE